MTILISIAFLLAVSLVGYCCQTEGYKSGAHVKEQEFFTAYRKNPDRVIRQIAIGAKAQEQIELKEQTEARAKFIKSLV